MKNKKSYRLQSKLMTYFFSLIMIIVIMLDIFFIYKMSEIVEKDTHVYAYEIVKQLGRNIESYIDHMREVMWMISSQDTSLINQLKEPLNQKAVRKSYFLEEMRNRGSSNGVVSINIFGENGLVLTDSASNAIKDYIDVKQMEWYTKAVEAQGKPVISASHTQNYLKNEGKWVFSLSAAIMEENKILGIVLIDMSYKNLTDMCNDIQLGEKGYVYIVGQGQEMIYHPKQQLIYSGILQEDLARVMQQEEGSFTEVLEDKRLVTVHSLKEVGWRVVGVSYIGELLVSKQEIIIPLIILTLLALVVAFLISKRIVSQTAKPIRELTEHMQEIELGKLGVEIDTQSDTEEIQCLTASFKEMVYKIEGLIEQVEDNQKKLRKSELKVLQSQINPHFLYNSLDTIIWLGEREECEKVVQMTAALARYFRLSLSKGKEVITIYEEVEHVKHYLQIQKIRYASKLTYTIEVSPDIFDEMIVKIVLQPLVENALYHGIKDLEEGGYIRVLGFREGNNIILEVYDNGKGMSREQIKNILKAPSSTSITKGGVAIKNVHERIQVYFGQDYGLSYESEYGKWTKVRITIPVIEIGEWNEKNRTNY
ncbi:MULTISPECIES: cache domain-containing sensor histidine kinase [Zhenhengia]|uniref:Sensor histidine kinase n=1 Tax=Zhenhengia yiwuensis TaxID=2763666 RepID=A0A926IDA1_9FIRM|nr:sensor histidine kinase [Zhenhengia yiwuensis]MBC8579532.1 sensor histidine kinase [Zhenhengia yiwuensis]MBS5800426.1 sensor histidine kinase [Clostridiales bacterium]